MADQFSFQVSKVFHEKLCSLKVWLPLPNPFSAEATIGNLLLKERQESPLHIHGAGKMIFFLLSTDKQAKKIAELGVGKTFCNRTVWTRSRRGDTNVRLERIFTLEFNPTSRFIGLWCQYLLIIGR